MALAFATETADALVAVLNSSDRSWKGQFTAERKYNPKFTLKELETLRVTVVPGDQTWERASRGLDKQDDELQLGFQKRVAAPTPGQVDEKVDELVYLVDTVGAYLRDYPILTWDGGTKKAIIMGYSLLRYDPELLDTAQTFMSVIVLTYRSFQ